jgi:hypothetical protein
LLRLKNMGVTNVSRNEIDAALDSLEARADVLVGDSIRKQALDDIAALEALAHQYATKPTTKPATSYVPTTTAKTPVSAGGSGSLAFVVLVAVGAFFLLR